MLYNLAVYGTLKRGDGNHRYLHGSEFLGEGYTQKGFGLVVDPDSLPFLVEDVDGPGCYVELYKVDENTLATLDRLESHPHIYCRKEISTYDLETGHEVKAFCYIFQHKDELRRRGDVLRFTRRY